MAIPVSMENGKHCKAAGNVFGKIANPAQRKVKCTKDLCQLRVCLRKKFMLTRSTASTLLRPTS